MTSRALRIGIDARELLGRPTGVGRYLSELLARWTRDPALAAHRLVLYAPEPLALGWIGAEGATVEPRVLPGGSGTRWEQLTLARAAADDDLTVYFAPAYQAPLRLRVPLVLSMHDVSFAARPQWFGWREGLRRRWLATWSARRAAAVLTLTAWSREEIVEHLGTPASRIHVVPPAVDTHPALARPAGGAAAASPEAGGPLVLYVGSIFNRRHVPAVIRGFSLLAQARADARLAVVGDNRTCPRQDLHALVTQLDLGARVTLYDYVNEETLAALYARARAFVFLSEYEGFGLTPLEAMARGVPAVLLDTPVARESCGEAADYVASPDDHEALRDALLRLLADGRHHASRVEAGRRRAAAFSWDRSARTTFDVIRSVIAG